LDPDIVIEDLLKSEGLDKPIAKAEKAGKRKIGKSKRRKR